MSEAHIGNVNAVKWAPEHDEMLRKMRADKISSSKIGDALNREFRTSYSRNAVIGRCQRLGLCVKAVPKPKKPLSASRPLREGCAETQKARTAGTEAEAAHHFHATGVQG